MSDGLVPGAEDPKWVHEMARKAREDAPVSIELDESDLFAMAQGRTLYEVLRVNEQHDWVDYIEITAHSAGTIGDRDIRESWPEVFAGVEPGDG